VTSTTRKTPIAQGNTYLEVIRRETGPPYDVQAEWPLLENVEKEF
jgi:hypothetical protein